MRFLVWIFVVPHLLLLDGWLAQRFGPWLDFTLAICLYLGLYARQGALPLLLVSTGLFRSVVVEGAAALQVLALGIPIGMLVALRPVLARHHLLWQALAAAFLALAVPRVTLLLGRLAGEDVQAATPTPAVLLVTLVAVPLLAWLLRVLPPGRAFVERSE